MHFGTEYVSRLFSKKKNLKKVESIPVSIPPLPKPKYFQDIIPPPYRPKIIPPTPPAPALEPVVAHISPEPEPLLQKEEKIDEGKRSFLKMASMAGLGAVALSVIPQKAEAYVMGATPSSSVVGVKDSTNARINPATEETLLTLVSGQGVVKKTVTLTGSGTVHTPAAGKKIRVYANRFSLSADMGNVSFRFQAVGTDFEKYVSPKTGGLYGANNHPNFVEGGVNEVVYCIINGTGSVQVNLDYIEV